MRGRCGKQVIFKRLLYWLLAHPVHRHHYALHIEMDDARNVKPMWRCMYFFCDREIEVDEF